MRFPIRRLLVVGGGAVILATAGFAYMASNTVQQSSAGEGLGGVSGYTVSGIQYVVDCGNTSTCAGYGDGADYYNGSTTSQKTDTTNLNAAISGVTFTLAAQSTDASAKGQPTNVKVYPEDSNHTALWGHDNGCTISGWNPSTGSGSVTCSFSPQVPASQLMYLDVEANQ
jgi:hypothetical protein